MESRSTPRSRDPKTSNANDAKRETNLHAATFSLESKDASAETSSRFMRLQSGIRKQTSVRVDPLNYQAWVTPFLSNPRELGKQCIKSSNPPLSSVPAIHAASDALSSDAYIQIFQSDSIPLHPVKLYDPAVFLKPPDVNEKLNSPISEQYKDSSTISEIKLNSPNQHIRTPLTESSPIKNGTRKTLESGAFSASRDGNLSVQESTSTGSENYWVDDLRRSHPPQQQANRKSQNSDGSRKSVRKGNINTSKKIENQTEQEFNRLSNKYIDTKIRLIDGIDTDFNCLSDELVYQYAYKQYINTEKTQPGCPIGSSSDSVALSSKTDEIYGNSCHSLPTSVTRLFATAGMPDQVKSNQTNKNRTPRSSKASNQSAVESKSSILPFSVSVDSLKNLINNLRLQDAIVSAWREKVLEILYHKSVPSNFITLEEAEDLFEEGRMINQFVLLPELSEFQQKVTNSQKFRQKLRGILKDLKHSTVKLSEDDSIVLTSENSVKRMNISQLQSLLHDSADATHFEIGEVTLLQWQLDQVICWRKMVHTAFEDKDLVKCSAVIEDGQDLLIDFPGFKDLNQKVTASSWIDKVEKMINRPLKLSVAEQLLQEDIVSSSEVSNAPCTKELRNRLTLAYQWLVKIHRPPFVRFVKNSMDDASFDSQLKLITRCEFKNNEELNFSSQRENSDTERAVESGFVYETTRLSIPPLSMKTRCRSGVIQNPSKASKVINSDAKASLEEGDIISVCCSLPTPIDIENVCFEFQVFKLQIPVFKHFESLNQKWRKWYKRYKKAIDGCYTLPECRMIIMDAELLTEVMDISIWFDKLKVNVDQSQKFTDSARSFIKAATGANIDSKIAEATNDMWLFEPLKKNTIQFSDIKNLLLLPVRSNRARFDELQSLLSDHENLLIKNWPVHKELYSLFEKAQKWRKRCDELLNGPRNGFPIYKLAACLLVECMHLCISIEFEEGLRAELNYKLWHEEVIHLKIPVEENVVEELFFAPEKKRFIHLLDKHTSVKSIIVERALHDNQGADSILDSKQSAQPLVSLCQDLIVTGEKQTSSSFLHEFSCDDSQPAQISKCKYLSSTGDLNSPVNDSLTKSIIDDSTTETSIKTDFRTDANLVDANASSCANINRTAPECLYVSNIYECRQERNLRWGQLIALPEYEFVKNLYQIVCDWRSTINSMKISKVGNHTQVEWQRVLDDLSESVVALNGVASLITSHLHQSQILEIEIQNMGTKPKLIDLQSMEKKVKSCPVLVPSWKFVSSRYELLLSFESEAATLLKTKNALHCLEDFLERVSEAGESLENLPQSQAVENVVLRAKLWNEKRISLDSSCGCIDDWQKLMLEYENINTVLSEAENLYEVVKQTIKWIDFFKKAHRVDNNRIMLVDAKRLILFKHGLGERLLSFVSLCQGVKEAEFFREKCVALLEKSYAEQSCLKYDEACNDELVLSELNSLTCEIEFALLQCKQKAIILDVEEYLRVELKIRQHNERILEMLRSRDFTFDFVKRSLDDIYEDLSGLHVVDSVFLSEHSSHVLDRRKGIFGHLVNLLEDHSSENNECSLETSSNSRQVTRSVSTRLKSVGDSSLGTEQSCQTSQKIFNSNKDLAHFFNLDDPLNCDFLLHLMKEKIFLFQQCATPKTELNQCCLDKLLNLICSCEKWLTAFDLLMLPDKTLPAFNDDHLLLPIEQNDDCRVSILKVLHLLSDDVKDYLLKKVIENNICKFTINYEKLFEFFLENTVSEDNVSETDNSYTNELHSYAYHCTTAYAIHYRQLTQSKVLWPVPDAKSYHPFMHRVRRLADEKQVPVLGMSAAVPLLDDSLPHYHLKKENYDVAATCESSASSVSVVKRSTRPDSNKRFKRNVKMEVSKFNQDQPSDSGNIIVEYGCKSTVARGTDNSDYTGFKDRKRTFDASFVLSEQIKNSDNKVSKSAQKKSGGNKLHRKLTNALKAKNTKTISSPLSPYHNAARNEQEYPVLRNSAPVEDHLRRSFTVRELGKAASVKLPSISEAVNLLQKSASNVWFKCEQVSRLRYFVEAVLILQHFIYQDFSFLCPSSPDFVDISLQPLRQRIVSQNTRQISLTKFPRLPILKIDDHSDADKISEICNHRLDTLHQLKESVKASTTTHNISEVSDIQNNAAPEKSEKQTIISNVIWRHCPWNCEVQKWELANFLSSYQSEEQFHTHENGCLKNNLKNTTEVLKGSVESHQLPSNYDQGNVLTDTDDLKNSVPSAELQIRDSFLNLSKLSVGTEDFRSGLMYISGHSDDFQSHQSFQLQVRMRTTSDLCASEKEKSSKKYELPKLLRLAELVDAFPLQLPLKGRLIYILLYSIDWEVQAREAFEMHPIDTIRRPWVNFEADALQSDPPVEVHAVAEMSNNDSMCSIPFKQKDKTLGSLSSPAHFEITEDNSDRLDNTGIQNVTASSKDILNTRSSVRRWIDSFASHSDETQKDCSNTRVLDVVNFIAKDCMPTRCPLNPLLDTDVLSEQTVDKLPYRESFLSKLWPTMQFHNIQRAFIFVTDMMSNLLLTQPDVCPICASLPSLIDDSSWIACDGCNRWYHASCVGFESQQGLNTSELWHCPCCILRSSTIEASPNEISTLLSSKSMQIAAKPSKYRQFPTVTRIRSLLHNSENGALAFIDLPEREILQNKLNCLDAYLSDFKSLIHANSYNQHPLRQFFRLRSNAELVNGFENLIVPMTNQQFIKSFDKSHRSSAESSEEFHNDNFASNVPEERSIGKLNAEAELTCGENCISAQHGNIAHLEKKLHNDQSCQSAKQSFVLDVINYRSLFKSDLLQNQNHIDILSRLFVCGIMLGVDLVDELDFIIFVLSDLRDWQDSLQRCISCITHCADFAILHSGQFHIQDFPKKPILLSLFRNLISAAPLPQISSPIWKQTLNLLNCAEKVQNEMNEVVFNKSINILTVSLSDLRNKVRCTGMFLEHENLLNELISWQECIEEAHRVYNRLKSNYEWMTQKQASERSGAVPVDPLSCPPPVTTSEVLCRLLNTFWNLWNQTSLNGYTFIQKAQYLANGLKGVLSRSLAFEQGIRSLNIFTMAREDVSICESVIVLPESVYDSSHSIGLKLFSELLVTGRELSVESACIRNLEATYSNFLVITGALQMFQANNRQFSSLEEMHKVEAMIASSPIIFSQQTDLKRRSETLNVWFHKVRSFLANASTLSHVFLYDTQQELLDEARNLPVDLTHSRIMCQLKNVITSNTDHDSNKIRDSCNGSTSLLT